MPVGVSRDRGPPAPTTTMGRPKDDRRRRRPPMPTPRRWVRRATLSALGGGLTAASLSGPLSGWAFGANPPNGTPNIGATEGSTAPVAAPEVASPAGPHQPTNTTSTPPAAASAPQASTPAAPTVPEAPPVVVQRRQ